MWLGKRGKEIGTGETERNSEKQARKEEIGPRASLTSRDPRHPESTSELGSRTEQPRGSPPGGCWSGGSLLGCTELRVRYFDLQARFFLVERTWFYMPQHLVTSCKAETAPEKLKVLSKTQLSDLPSISNKTNKPTFGQSVSSLGWDQTFHDPLGLPILLPLPLSARITSMWHHVLPGYVLLGIGPRASCMLGKQLPI